MTESLIHKVLAAEYPEDIFPADDEPAQKEYRRLAKLLHPDASETDTTEAFQHLADLWEWHRTGSRPKGTNQIILTTKRRTYVLGGLVYSGDVANLYRGTYDDEGKPAKALLKMCRDPEDNDLLIAESVALKAILSDVDGKWHAFFPHLIETFRHQDNTTKVRRRVNAIEPLEGFFTLSEVLDAYPQGLHPKDLAWMWRRLLVALAVAHDAGLVHGAPTPENVLIHPEKHGVVLTDWCYSTKSGELLKAIPDKRSQFYPGMDIEEKLPTSGALDMFVAHKTMQRMLDPAQTPRPFVVFLTGVLQARSKSRPEAGETLEALDDLLFRLYGPRKFREFKMPTT